MPEPIHLLDNDIVLKGARFDVLPEIECLCGGIARLRILNTLWWKFGLDNQAKALAYCATIEAFNRLRKFARNAPLLEPPENTDDIVRLNKLLHLDEGEVLLFAYNIYDPGSITFTGDKRAILSISNAAEVADLVSIIRGRVKCLEQVVAELLLKFDAASLKSRIMLDRGCDRSLGICFSPNSTKEMLQALYSYYNDLNSKTNGILAPFPSF